MKKSAIALAFVGALSSLAAAQDDARTLWTDLAETRPFSAGVQESGGQVHEEWYSAKLRGSLSVFGRLSFPGNTDVTVDGLWYSDFFSYGYGIGIEGDLLTFVTPHWGVGPYLSVAWDRFKGDTLHFFNGDFADVGDMDMTTVVVGAKVVQRISPFVIWEGRLGVGWAGYDRVTWSGVDSGVPFSDEELFKTVNRGLFEIGARIGVGNRQIQGDFGFGLRYLGAAARGRDVTNFVDPDLMITFMLELGLTIRF